MFSSEKKQKGISVFISYRRSTGREVARNLYERLSMNGINTFFDYNSMREGKFNKQIFAAIEQAKDFIFVLSNDALDRCVNEDDWVRIEIEHALKYNKNIIIVSTQETITFPKNLPQSLVELSYYQAVTLSQEYYDESIKRIIGMLSDNPHKRKQKKAILISTIFIGFALIIAGTLCYNMYCNRLVDKSLSNSDVMAKLYLPRYGDINREILNKPFFEDESLNAFSYVDTIINEGYMIYPKSSFMTSPYSNFVSVQETDSLKVHNLPIRVRIYNPKSKTVIINKATLQLFNIKPLIHLSASIIKNDSGLILRNEDNFTMPRYKLKYSYLKPNESFIDYKNEVLISSQEYTLIPPEENIRIKGRIEYNDSYWNFDTQFSEYNHLIQTPSSMINPVSSDYYISICKILSMSEIQDITLENFNRKLVKGEVDDNIFIIIKSSNNFVADTRILLTTIDHQEIYSDFIRIIYINPKNFEYEPF